MDYSFKTVFGDNFKILNMTNKKLKSYLNKITSFSY